MTTNVQFQCEKQKHPGLVCVVCPLKFWVVNARGKDDFLRSWRLQKSRLNEQVTG